MRPSPACVSTDRRARPGKHLRACRTTPSVGRPTKRCEVCALRGRSRGTRSGAPHCPIWRRRSSTPSQPALRTSSLRTPLALTVRIHEPRRTAANGNILHLRRIVTATNCSEMKGIETGLYARSYTRPVPFQATDSELAVAVANGEDGTAARLVSRSPSPNGATGVLSLQPRPGGLLAEHVEPKKRLQSRVPPLSRARSGLRGAAAAGAVMNGLARPTQSGGQAGARELRPDRTGGERAKGESRRPRSGLTRTAFSGPRPVSPLGFNRASGGPHPEDSSSHAWLPKCEVMGGGRCSTGR
jgi:hypothetical protein